MLLQAQGGHGHLPDDSNDRVDVDSVFVVFVSRLKIFPDAAAAASRLAAPPPLP